MVEAALAGIVFLSVTLAVIDFGRMFHTRSKLQHAVSQSTRFAVTGNRLDDPDSPGDKLSRQGSIVSMIERLSGIEDFGPNDVEIATVIGPDTFSPGPGGPGDVVMVRVTYRIDLVSPFLALIFDEGRYEFSCSTRCRNEEFSAGLFLEPVGTAMKVLV